MNTLTLHQPYASLVAVGAKSIETRTWRTDYRGPLAIHAGAKWTSQLCWLTQTEDILAALDKAGIDIDTTHHRASYKPLPLGAVVASATLIDCVPMEALRWSSDGPRNHRGETVVSVEHPWTHMLTARTGDLLEEVIVHESQRPFGDFSPGRFAWLLGDVKPTTERCPWCAGAGGRRETGTDHGDYGSYGPCPACNGATMCGPVPARGKQGLWEWTPEKVAA